MAPEGDGLRWSFELDLVSVLEAIGRPLRDWDGVDQEEDLAAEVAALGLTDFPPGPPRPRDPRGRLRRRVAGGVICCLSRRRAARAAAAAPARCARRLTCAAGAVAGPDQARRPGRDLGGAVAEVLPTGPGLAAWLAGQDPATAAGGDLVGMAGAFRRVASWAQARELELIAHVAARSAAADPKAGLAR